MTPFTSIKCWTSETNEFKQTGTDCLQVSMTVIAILDVIIIYSYFQMPTVSFEVLPNYQPQLPRDAMYPRLPNLNRENLMNFCLLTNLQNLCSFEMESSEPAEERTKPDREKSSMHRRNLIPFITPRNSRGISNDFTSFSISKGNGNHFLDVNRKKLIYGTTHFKEPQTKSAIVASNKKRTNSMYAGKETKISRIEYSPKNAYVVLAFVNALDQLERKFYATTYAQISAISPSDRKINGISFALSSLFLQITLIALSTVVDAETRSEIDRCTGFYNSEQDKIKIIKDVISWLPVSNDGLKFRYATRLVLRSGLQVSQRFISQAASALQIKISYVNGTEAADDLTRKLNKLVEVDSGGAMRDTFDEEELEAGVCGALLSTLHVRARWRAAPTLLNGSLPFRDLRDAPAAARMIRINDVMRYARLREWDAEALEINYATPGLTFFLLFPRGRSLRNLAAKMSVTSLRNISNRMRTLRIAATLPLYTLRMTLLLPAKLQAMGVNRLILGKANDACDGVKLSHAVQRIMFWSEAGRYAFKDDGFEWDETPELNIIIDRPYLYYVRWHNITILNGNFVL